MRVNARGQVTIPRAIRRAAGLPPGAEVELVLEGSEVTIRPARALPTSKRSKRVVRRLRGSATVPMTSDEILRLMRGR